MMREVDGDVNTIDEFLALIELEPTLRYVLVEGRGDASFFNWYLEANQVDVRAYAVSDRLDIRRHELSATCVDYGEREKLNTLADRFHKALGADHRSLTIILDADWTEAIGPLPIVAGCRIVTDFPSLEFYFFEEAPFNRFIQLGLGREPVDYMLVRSAIDRALVQVGSARLVLKQGDIECVEAFADLCNLTHGKSGANVREIMRRSINKVDRTRWPAAIDELVLWAQYFEELLESSGHRGRGHDIAPLLARFLNLKNKDGSPELIERLMRSTADANELGKYPMFETLLERLIDA